MIMDWKNKLVDKVKGAIFEEEVEQTPSPQVVSSSPEPRPNPSFSEASVNKDLLNKIEKKIQEADIPGPDYLELKKAAEESSLVKDEPDEGKRWRQAFRNMKIFFPQAEITKAKILGAIDHYIGIVNREEAIGMEQLEEIRGKEVNGEQEIVDSLAGEILELEKKILEKKAEKESREQKILANRRKYDSQELSFKRTIGFARDILEKDKTRVTNYIEN